MGLVCVYKTLTALLVSSAVLSEVGKLCIEVVLRHLYNAHNLYIGVEVIELIAGFSAIVLKQPISVNAAMRYLSIVPSRVDAKNVEFFCFSSHNVDPFKIVLYCVNSLLTSYISIIAYGCDTLGHYFRESSKIFKTSSVCLSDNLRSRTARVSTKAELILRATILWAIVLLFIVVSFIFLLSFMGVTR